MKTFYFEFDRLTWPEVAALEPTTPLVIPLGQGYDMDRLASVLGYPAQVGLLPPIPFGWQNSGLWAPEPMLGAMLKNLIHSLRDDGFSRVYCLTPQDMHLELGESQLSLPHASQYAPTSFLPADAEREKVILIPIGHTEQHAYHLPLSTDTLIIEAIGQGTAAAIPGQAFCLPVMPYGVSTHRPAFAGTLNCGGRAFEDFWVAIIDTLVVRGFSIFYFLNGHGGNGSFLVNVVKYSGERHRRIFCATAFLYLSGPGGIVALEKLRNSPIGGMGHACELETSIILHLRPELAHIERVVDETDFIATPAYYMDWVEGGALIANPPWDDDTQTGAYGAGSLATAEKGKAWLAAAISEKASHVAEIHEQQARREARRQSGFGLWAKTARK